MTILSVDFISRGKAEILPPDSRTALISITEPDSGMARLAEFPKLLRLVFHDVDSPEYEGTIIFDETMAQQVVEFVDALHASPDAYHVRVHCHAGISRSAAVALYVAEVSGCEFARRPFAGLANRLILRILAKLSGRQLERPRALPKRERFFVDVSRNFETGLAQVMVENVSTGERVTLERPMLEVPSLIQEGVQQVWGMANPPPAHHVRNWDHLDVIPDPPPSRSPEGSGD